MSSYPSNAPAWQETILNNLSKTGKLFGLNPVIFEAIAQNESEFEYKGAGINTYGGGYGGYFGLGQNVAYPGGTPSTALLLTNSPSSFTTQSEIAASEINALLNQYNGNITTAITKYQGGGGGDVTLVNNALGGASPYLSGKAGQGILGSLYGVNQPGSPNYQGLPSPTNTGGDTAIPPGAATVVGPQQSLAQEIGSFLSNPLGSVIGPTLLKGFLILVGVVLLLIGVSKLFSGNTDSNPVITLVEGSEKVADTAKDTAKKGADVGAVGAAA